MLNLRRSLSVLVFRNDSAGLAIKIEAICASTKN